MTKRDAVRIVSPRWRRTFRRSRVGEGDPAGTLESRAGQRLDCLHRRQWPPCWSFPFPFLTMPVSLEAIFLALFVLANQNRLARQADNAVISTCRSICSQNER